METLPLDILYCICDYFKGKRNTLKAVRLVNKNSAAAAAPFLFQTLLVYQTPRSWKKMGWIARCPWLAKNVVRLEVAALNYLPHYLDFRDWKKCTWFPRWDDCCGHNIRAAMVALLVEESETRPFEIVVLDRHMRFEDWRQHPEVRKRNDQLDMDIQASEIEVALDLASGYEKYRYWHDGENELSDLLYPSQDPQLALDSMSFPNLQTVAVLGSHNIWKFRESCVRVGDCAHVESVQKNVHMSLALRALDASGVYITRLELHRYREVLRDAQFSMPPLKKLQELVLDLPYRIDYSETVNYRGRWELPIWLGAADDLRTLIISSQGPQEDDRCLYFDVIALFHGAKWPRLQCVHFKETFVRPKSLLQFLSEHTQSLESIHVEHPIISKGAWQSLASEFQDLHFNSPHCVVHMDILYRICDAYPPESLENANNWIDRSNRP